MRLDAVANVFDVLVGKRETMAPLLEGDLAVAVRVALVQEIADAVFQRLERGDEGEKFRTTDDPILGRVHLAKLPQNWHDFRMFRPAGAPVHIRKFDVQLLPLVQSFHDVGQPRGHSTRKRG